MVGSHRKIAEWGETIRSAIVRNVIPHDETVTYLLLSFPAVVAPHFLDLCKFCCVRPADGRSQRPLGHQGREPRALAAPIPPTHETEGRLKVVVGGVWGGSIEDNVVGAT